jgi:IS1 family transposase/transposase-like protein
MDATNLFCNHRVCSKYGMVGQPNILWNGASHSKTPQYGCKVCRRYFSLRTGTAFFGLYMDEAIITPALKALAEGMSIRATSRICDVDKDTIALWLNRAGTHCKAVMAYLLKALPLRECQLDELWTFLYKKERNLDFLELLAREYGDMWVWVCFEARLKLIPAFVIRKRTQEQANELIRLVKERSDGHIPFFTSDQLPHYADALLEHYGIWYQPERKGSRGRFPQSIKIAPPHLQYAVVVKHRQRGRVVKVERRIVFGTQQAIDLLLQQSPISQMVNTSYVERENLNLRQGSRRLTRKTNGFSKNLQALNHQLNLSIAYYHFVRPHETLKSQLASPLPTKGARGSKKRWSPRTPAMATGLTDHVWTMEELLHYRVPPIH